MVMNGAIILALALAILIKFTLNINLIVNRQLIWLLIYGAKP